MMNLTINLIDEIYYYVKGKNTTPLYFWSIEILEPPTVRREEVHPLSYLIN